MALRPCLKIAASASSASASMELVHNRSFILTTGNGQQIRLRCLRGGVPQGSVFALSPSTSISMICQKLSPLSIFTQMTLPSYTRQYIGTHCGNFKPGHEYFENLLYLQKWKLKLSKTKTMSAAFHLHNKEAKRALSVTTDRQHLPLCLEHKYLGVILDRSLTFRRHLKSLHKKLTSGVALSRKQAGSSCTRVLKHCAQQP